MRSHRQGLFSFIILVFLVFSTAGVAYAKKWNVYPTMTRAAIQAVIDTARDGDMIFFNPGLYDFSDGPFVDRWMNDGALRIYDKSLVIRGTADSILQGKLSDVGGDWIGNWVGVRGINCFWICNPKGNKDVTIDGLSIQTFLVGVFAVNSNESSDSTYLIYYPNLRNLTIKNCHFTDMHRNGISTAGIQGDITITNNTLIGVDPYSRFGIYLDWYWEPGHLEWQPTNKLVTIKNNSIRNYCFGIYALKASNVLITSNTIATDSINYSCTGIDLPSGLKNAATISNNALSNFYWGIDIWGGTYVTAGGSFVPFDATGVVVKHNNISGISGDGIRVGGDFAFGNSFVYNMLDLVDLWASHAIYSEGHNNQYRNNVIRGEAKTAVYLSGWDDAAGSGLFTYAHNELFKANCISGLSSQLAHYTLDANTHDNTIIGLETENATYTDFGTNNFFKYVYPYVPSATTGIAASKAGIPDKAKETGPKRGALPL